MIIEINIDELCVCICIYFSNNYQVLKYDTQHNKVGLILSHKYKT